MTVDAFPRFSPPAPGGIADGPNLYTYVRQNPWTFFDPTGLKLEEPERQDVPNDASDSDRAAIERNNRVADLYTDAKENSPAFRKMVDNLKGADDTYSIKEGRTTMGGPGEIGKDNKTAIIDSQKATVETMAEEVAHLTQNEASKNAQAEYTKALGQATTSEERTAIEENYRKEVGNAVLPTYEPGDHPTEWREQQGTRAANIVSTEVKVATAKPGNMFYKPTPGVIQSNAKKSYGNRQYGTVPVPRPYGGYQFNEMKEIIRSR